MMPAADWLAKRARLSPNRVALIDAATGRRISYAEWNARANRAAHALQALGLRKGDLLAILSTNRLEYLDLLFACQKVGVILQALNFRLAVPELQALLQDIPPRALIYSGDLMEKAAALEEAVPVTIALDEPVRGAHHRWRDLQDRASDRPVDPAPLALDDPWVLCYTGGTTGLPKAAILTHGTITWNAVNTVTSWGLRPDDVAILNAPLFHTGGLNVFTTPLVYIGGASILCSAFDPDQVFDLLEREQVTLFFGVPTMFIRLQQHSRWGQADFSRCRIVISGGAPCPMPVFERFFEKGVPFKTGYGLTEAGPNNFWLPDEKTRRKPGSVGSPLFHVEVRVVHDGCDVAPGEVGELWIRGPHVIPGYWNRPEETARTIVEGWLRTGDLALFDEEGDFYIVGRIKDVIISGGENIYPAEVESVMLGHPDVAEAALIGVPDPEWGEVGRAIVARRPWSALTEAELLAYLRARLASYKVPKSVVFVEELPKTGAGKIDRIALRGQYGTQRE